RLARDSRRVPGFEPANTTARILRVNCWRSGAAYLANRCRGWLCSFVPIRRIPNVTTLESFDVLDAEEFRRQLAGLGSAANTPEAWKEEHKDAATDLCVALALAFNRDVLDPLSLWDRISTAI